MFRTRMFSPKDMFGDPLDLMGPAALGIIGLCMMSAWSPMCTALSRTVASASSMNGSHFSTGRRLVRGGMYIVPQASSYSPPAASHAARSS